MMCPHCGHPLRGHKIQRPVYDRVAWFACSCGCEVDGSIQRRRVSVIDGYRGSNETGGSVEA